MEGFVCIEKQEKLEQFTFGDFKLKEMVLTDVDPFPGYYSETPGESDGSKPKFVFIAIKQGKGCYEDEVLRASYSLKAKLNYKFHANYGRFLLFNKMKPCIRIRIDDYANVPEIIENLKNEGLEFETSQKISAFDCNIKIRKYMTFKEMSKGVYSSDDPGHYFIEVPEHLKWDDFKALIYSIRRSGDFGVFDAAQTSFYLKDQIIEFVRIYTKSFKKEDFDVLKEQILKRF